MCRTLESVQKVRWSKTWYITIHMKSTGCLIKSFCIIISITIMNIYKL